MRDQRTDFFAYIEDLARRHVDIAHDPATKATKRFYLELDYEKLLGDTAPNNTGWNLVLMGYETSTDDNRHGRRVERITFIFDILKHVKQGDPTALQATYNQARIIGEELLAHMEQQQKDPCTAVVSPDVLITYSLRMGTKRTTEVGPRWDHFFGYRFMADLLQEMPFRPTSAPDRWRLLGNEPEPEPELIDGVVVSGAGNPEANGLYLPDGETGGRTRYRLQGSAYTATSNAESVLFDNGGLQPELARYDLYDANENQLYTVLTDGYVAPWDESLTWTVGVDGTAPVPTIRQATTADLP
jgi:hypothetical protein